MNGDPSPLLLHEFMSRFGETALVWYDDPSSGPRVRRIFLSSEELGASDAVMAEHPGTVRGTRPEILRLAGEIIEMLRGRAPTFDISLMDLEACPRFQRDILSAVSAVPRGRIRTYGWLACIAGRPAGARAAGAALARNPFPLVVPCHRVVRWDGSLGRYQGGGLMKRRLLEIEGVRFGHGGKAVPHSNG